MNNSQWGNGILYRNGEYVNSDYYFNLLEKLHERICEKIHFTTKKNHFPLRQRPPYSPDLSP